MNQDVKSTVSIIVDTNVWISYLMGKTLVGLERYICNQNVQLVSCKEQLAELREVLFRPKMQRYFSTKQIDYVLNLFTDNAESVRIHSQTDLCRDKKDNYLLSLALDSHADYLLTGDNDLLVLKQTGNTQILKYADFENMMDFFLKRQK